MDLEDESSSSLCASKAKHVLVTVDRTRDLLFAEAECSLSARAHERCGLEASSSMAQRCIAFVWTVRQQYTSSESFTLITCKSLHLFTFTLAKLLRKSLALCSTRLPAGHPPAHLPTRISDRILIAKLLLLLLDLRPSIQPWLHKATSRKAATTAPTTTTTTMTTIQPMLQRAIKAAEGEEEEQQQQQLQHQTNNTMQHPHPQ